MAKKAKTKKKKLSKTAKKARAEYAKMSAWFRKQYKRVREKAPYAAILGQVDPHEFAGLRTREFLGEPTNTKALRTLTKRLKTMQEQQVLSTVAIKRSMNGALRYLRDQGYDFINKNNIVDFLKFLDRVREMYAEQSPYIDTVAQWYGEGEGASQSDLVKEAWQSYLNNLR